MARARKKRRLKKRTIKTYEDAIRWVSAIALIASGVLLALGSFGAAGPLGSGAFELFYTAIGIGAFLLPIGIITLGLYAGFRKPAIAPLTAGGSTLLLAAVLSFAGLSSTTTWGGDAGLFVGHALKSFFGFWGTLVLLLAVVLIAFVVLIDVEIILIAIANFFSKVATKFHNISFLQRSARINVHSEKREEGEDKEYEDEEEYEEAEEDEVEEDEEPIEREPTITVFNKKNEDDIATTGVMSIADFDEEYKAPPVSLLGKDTNKPGVGDIKANTNIIKRTFQNFGIPVEMDEVSVGPTVTRYAFKPAEGVRLSRIISLQNNLELALAAHPVRIEAPIPGKSLVGIEVPNTSKATVGLGGLLSSKEWVNSKKALLATIGRDITGTPHYANIAKMPHALVAGATGSGKSVTIHSIITSLLYRNGPNQLRFIMIDPKRVELTLYNGIPHLLTPVITDPKKAILALKWAGKEMDRRYNILEAEHVRDIDSYHRTVNESKQGSSKEDALEAMPYIIIVIDELADIMQSYPRELEASIVRLAQMSRAVGIHLVLSTQRPSVNVITGLIKANVPTRLALQVASQIDSRTILDCSGAEMLLGAGDMLYLSSDRQKPVRIQTAYISESEVKKIVQYIKQNNVSGLSPLDLNSDNQNSEPNDAILLSEKDDDVDDDLYGDARAIVEEAGRASTSYLQRKLRIGYSRAARLMDILEEKGIIGPADGSRPREILPQPSDSEEITDTAPDDEDETDEDEREGAT